MDNYEDILTRMKDMYKELSGFMPSEESDIMLRLKVLAGEVFNLSVATEFVKEQMFVSTACASYLDKHALERGLFRKEAEKAYGELTFSTYETAIEDIVIDKGTVVSTLDESPCQYITTSSVTLKAGEISVKAPAQAINAGNDSNALANTITVMVTPPAGIVSVKNEKAFKGGVDAETDEELRKRVLDSYRDISNSTNAIYYKRLVESVPGVYSSSVIPLRRGPGTVDVYICGKGDAQTDSTHVDKAQALVDQNRELCLEAFVYCAHPREVHYRLSLDVHDGYAFEEVSARVIENMTEYIDNVGVGNPLLLSDLGEVIYHTTGVRNYSFFDGFCIDIFPLASEYCVVKEIDIREWR